MNIEKKLKADLATATFEYRQAEVQMKELSKKMDKFRMRIEYIASVLGDGATAPEEEVAEADEGKSLAGKPAVQVIEAVLREAGTKLKLKDIVNRAIMGGYAEQKDFTRIRANFSSLLTRAARENRGPFIKEERGVFALANNHGKESE